MVSAQARREQVRFAVGRGLSQRRACALLSVARSALSYTSKMLEKDVPALGAMSVLSAHYPRFGYRRVHVFMERQCFQISHGRAWRLWSKGNLQVPRKRPRRRVAGSRPRPCIARGPGQVWAYDFVHDACANGQKIKCLTVIDEFTKVSLTIDVAGAIRSGRVVEVLSQLVSVHGAPRYIRSHRGEGRHRTMATALQRGQAAQQSRLPDPERVRAARMLNCETGGRRPGMTGPTNRGRSRRRT